MDNNNSATKSYYAGLLNNMSQKIHEKHPGLSKRKILLFQDNALVHASKVLMDKIQELRYEKIPYPAHSQDFSPSGFFVDAKP